MMRFSALLLAGALAVGALPAGAHDGKDDALEHRRKALQSVVKSQTPENVDLKARRYFTDGRVVDQNGREMRFYSDVLKDRVVVVTLFYTECQGMCPITNQKLSEVQDILGDAMGRDFWFVSVSLDPETDTPEVLKEYAAKFGAGPGWLFVTGRPEDLSAITYRLGQTDPEIAAHNPYFMLGNVRRAHWKRLAPNQPATAIAQHLRLLATGSMAPASAN